MKRKIITLLQLLIGVGLLVFIFRKVEDKGGNLLDAVGTAMTNWPWIVAAMILFGFCMITCIARWNLIMIAQGLVMPFRRVTVLYFVGHFFNAFMLGATGGDVIKAFYVAAETKHKRTEAVATVFIDRTIGLLALILLATTTTLLRFSFFWADPKGRLAVWFSVALFITAVLGFIAMFRKNIFEHWAFFRRLEENTALGRQFSRMYNAFHVCLQRPSVLIKTMTLSLLNHLGLIVLIFCLGQALEIRLPFRDYLAVFPVVNTIAGLPITPSGIGTRDGTTVYFLGLLGTPIAQAFALSLATYLLMLAWSVAGGIVYFFFLYGSGKVPQIDNEDVG